MTGPSRRPEIARRRARKEKLTLLRKRYTTAANAADRDKIVAKIKRIYPGRSPEEVLRVQEKA